MYTESDIRVIENFMPLHYQKSMLDFFTSAEFPIYLDSGTVIDKLERVTAEMPIWLDDNTQEHRQLIHSFVARGEIQSQFWPRLAPLYFELERQLEFPCQILRAKLNVNTPDYKFGPNDHYPAHIDVAQKDCWTAIYYVHDSDGDTIWFNDSMQEIKRVAPKQGTLVLFPCRIRHAGTPPKLNHYRTVINFNVRQELNTTSGSRY